MIWLSAEEARGLMEIGRSWLKVLVSTQRLTTREGPKAANGKYQREILLESLPPAAQAKYFKQQNTSTIVDVPDSSAAITEDGESAKAPTSRPAEPRFSAALSPSASGASQISNLKLQIDPSASLRTGNPLAGLSEEKLEELTDYAEKIKMADGKSRQQRRWIARGLKVSIATLDRDLAAFREHGLAALVRAPRADRGASRVADQQVIARVQAEYLKPYRPSGAAVHRTISKDYEMSGLTPPSYSFVRRTIEQIAPDMVARFRHGEREFDDKFAYISLRKKPPGPRQWVDADHHQCDHNVRFPDGQIGRPWITATQDICTNEILGFHIGREKKTTYPGALAIGLALRQSILRKDDPAWPSFGIFENFYHDLGKDFRSQHVRAVCADLNIKAVPTRGYHGKSKPIERWFGILEDNTRHLPGYCGNAPGNNPERQKLKPEALDEKKLLTVDEYADAVRRWILEEFHHRASRALAGLSPVEALAAHVKNGFSAREVRDERVLDLLLMRRKGAPVKVHNYGVALFARPYMSPELLDLIGQYVEPAWDPDKIGEIILYQGSRFVCKATNKELLDFGASEATHKRELELKRTQKRRVNERYQEIVEEAQYPNPLARAAAETRYEKALTEERQKIAVNAEAESVAVLLPKYQQASKAISRLRQRTDQPRLKRSALSPVKRSPIENLKSKIQNSPRESWEIEDELQPKADQPMAEPKSAWLEEMEREEPATGAEIFKREEKADWEKALDAEEEDR